MFSSYTVLQAEVIKRADLSQLCLYALIYFKSVDKFPDFLRAYIGFSTGEGLEFLIGSFHALPSQNILNGLGHDHVILLEVTSQLVFVEL